MPTNKYWQDRFTQLEGQAHRNAAQTLAQLEQAYKQAQAEIEKQTLHWYQRFADNNGITMAQARVRLNDPQLKELKWTVQEYIKAGREMALDGRWMKELENASARFHITRFEALQLQNQQTIEALFGNQRDQMDRLLKRQFLDSYYHTAFEVQRGFGVGWDIAALDEGALARIINRPWSTDGKNFSERIWGSKQRLIGELQKEMTQNLLTGKAPDASIDAIAKQFGVSRNQAGRLVMTESAYFASISQQDAFNNLGVKQFQIVATLDERTSDICQELDGQVFEMKDFEAGVSAPPFHPWCRSVTAPYFDDLQGIGERAARGEDGSVYYVPREMKYEEWHDTFVSGGSKANVQPVSPSSPVAQAIAGVPMGMPMSFSKANTGRVNPNYGQQPGYSINCQTCVPTFEARLRGYDVQAKPNIRGSVCERLSRKTNLAWIDPATGKNPDYIFDDARTTPKKYLEFIKSTIHAGERYSIEFNWKGRRRTGHIVNIDLNENGLLRIKDNQRGNGETSEWIGDRAVLTYLSQMKYTTTVQGWKFPTVPKLLRLDNMNFDFGIVNEIMEGVRK